MTTSDSPAPPDLSIVIVTYNCRDLALACLESVRAAADNLDTEIAVVDNASIDDTVPVLAEAHPDVQVLEMGWNSGFGRACNRGIAATTGRHILLLNPDTEVADGALSALVRFLDEHPTAGVAAPRLLYPDLTDQGTARSFPTASAALFGRRSPLTRLFPNNRWSRRYLSGLQRSGDAPFEVDWVSGACLTVRRSVVAGVGVIDEDFFMHWEDAEWCHRIKTAGHSVWAVPEARVIHAEGGVRGGWPTRQIWHFHRGAYLYWRKAGRGGNLWPLRPIVYSALAIRAGLVIAKNAVIGIIGRGSAGSEPTVGSGTPHEKAGGTP